MSQCRHYTKLPNNKLLHYLELLLQICCLTYPEHRLRFLGRLQSLVCCSKRCLRLCLWNCLYKHTALCSWRLRNILRKGNLPDKMHHQHRRKGSRCLSNCCSWWLVALWLSNTKGSCISVMPSILREVLTFEMEYFKINYMLNSEYCPVFKCAVARM
jgi:hypothetical protein